ncbi:MAG: L-seryl-tRNA(Sec) selenium transferase [Candidatus Binatales bacterium]
MAANANKRRAARPPADDRLGDQREDQIDLLRGLPAIDECLRAADQFPALAALARPYVKLMLQRALAEIRATIKTGGSREAGGSRIAQSRGAIVEEILRGTERAIAADEPLLKPVVNATGVVLHTNLGRALLPEAAIEAVAQAARAPANLEYDLSNGSRGDRDTLVEAEICALTGAEAATVVNNNAAAVLLALNSLADGREVIVSRGELIEIGGSFRLPEIMARSGARLREVGTTNRTHPRDYVNAIGPDSAMLLKVHPSNYRVTGFTAEVALAELVEIGRAHGVAVMEDLGSGALIDLSEFGLPREPIVSERIAAGAGLVTFSGDKLLGGPQAGLIAGKRELIAKLRGNPLKRALRCDKLTLAALSATLRLYLRSGAIDSALPTLRHLRRSVRELEAAAIAAQAILAERLGGGFRIEVVASASQVGSGSLPAAELETRALRVTHDALSPDAIAALFRRARIIGRIADDAFQLDLRTVEDPQVFAAHFPEAIETNPNARR